MTMLAGPFTEKGTLFGKGSLPVVERNLAFLEERHKLISHNIANVHTRFFKAKDLPEEDFLRLLNKSMDARDHKHVRVFEMIHNSKVYGDWDGGDGFLTEDTAGEVLRHSDNNVDIDKEMTKLARNGLMYQTMSSLAKKNYDLLRSTIRETA
ncbi:MAG: flagellar basal body rod protein FlgB [Planctomycetes bacterium]|nr:flagellar basal body rod protein FlgB [Planctomycetota bacterium]NUQ35018.1 flagellar basal body rod protein FlgB [Planctomycetaceae bacterium]